MGKYVIKSGGRTEPKEKIIYHMPLKTSLEDISGYNRVSIYGGDTAQTITVANGLYLYNNSVSLDMSFLNDIIDNKFIVDFDFQYQSTGTNKYPYYRRFMYWYPLGIDVSYSGNKTTNYIAISQYNIGTTFNTTNKYNDMLWHHMTVFVDLNTKTFTMSIDNGVEILSIAINSALDSTMYLGHEDYGLNGYIRNFVIATTEMTDFTQLPVKDGFKGCFDYTNYNGGNIWTNQYTNGSRINFNMSNAVKSDRCVLFPEKIGLGYLIDDIGNNFTLYSIFKCDHSNSAQTARFLVWLVSALGANVNYRMYLYQDPGPTDYFGVLSGSGDNNNQANFNNVNFYDYCVAAISVCNGQQKVYINGELKWTGTNMINYSIDEIGINLNASGYGGAVPTINNNNTANVYVKYIGYATNNHNEAQIQ